MQNNEEERGRVRNLENFGRSPHGGGYGIGVVPNFWQLRVLANISSVPTPDVDEAMNADKSLRYD
ncbi:MAG TPA: hypothetical protein VGV92_03450 [Gammaproteobacteria bacterium]|nr:hypothetical protein [Gammaproteobacteria bacterium]